MLASIDGLRAEAAALGLQIQLGLGPGYDQRAGPGLRLRELAPWARGGLLLLSGGPAFFERFAAEAKDERDPLDAWTRRKVKALVTTLRHAGLRAEARFPFWSEPDPLPFQRIGAAAGLGNTLLGLTAHPAFGTWLAYRALLLFDQPVAETPASPHAPCAGCAAPCIAVCPAGAIGDAGWSASICLDHRLDHGDPCTAGCHARLACPAGARERYGEEALRFHQAASFATASALRAAPCPPRTAGEEPVS